MWRAFALDHPRVVNTDFAGFDRPGINGQVRFLKRQRVVVLRIDFNGGIVILCSKVCGEMTFWDLLTFLG